MKHQRSHTIIDARLLKGNPLPPLSEDDDKETRGRVLVVGGSMLVPGAIILAGIAALRSGAGKLQLGTISSSAVVLGLTVPEALVISLPQTRHGEIAGTRAGAELGTYLNRADGVLVGPGMSANPSLSAMLAAVVSGIDTHAVLVLDGAAVSGLRNNEKVLKPLSERVLLTPHAGEMAAMLKIDQTEVKGNAPVLAQEVANWLGAVVVLKGPETWIASPDQRLACYKGGSVGLGTSGSGDVLAGIIVGLAASGADPYVAALWGVWAHGEAGRVLSRDFGRVGFLARDLLPLIPVHLGDR
jgi:hydroxyethylthiazole kinase-like uncharacterized protein yjeF